MQVSGELRQWHKVTLDFAGPSVGETASTFRDYRLDVTFTNAKTGTKMTVPGYFAADGDAGNSGATSGNVWRVHFNPPETGEWTWKASFRTGRDVAVSRDPLAGTAVKSIDGSTGSFSVTASDKSGADLRGKGMLQYDGDQYLNFAGDGSVFLKSGVGSPENFLAYSGFDNTPDSHSYAAHAGAYRSGDPSWAGGKGKGIIGAVNYLAANDVNSAYMMLMNVGGDGRDVWPWSATDLHKIAPNSTGLTSPTWSFDVSKLAQWEIVFKHMQEKGITLHLFLQETENDQLLNNGDLGLERMLYMREMVARFGHHNGVIFNLGEENTNSAAQLKAHSAYLKALDAYDHPVALHTYPGQHSKYEQFEGSETLDVLSFQTSSDTGVPDFDRYLGGAKAAGRPVAAFIDEPGSASIGLAAEGDSGWQTNHANLREVLWTSYAEGGSGAEWYFGYKTAGGKGGDLLMEDFSLRESAYGWAAAARRFFEGLPLERMSDGDALTSGTSGADEVLAKKGEVYAIYLPDGGSATLDLSGVSGTFGVSWYDVIKGTYHNGSVSSVSGGGKVSLGNAPYSQGKDWAILVQAGEGAPAPSPEPEPTPSPAPESGVVYRWSAGTSTVAATDGGLAWVADPGAIVGAAKVTTSAIASSGILHTSVPGTTPKGIFAQEYYGSSKSSPVGLEFGDGKLANGSYAVRLYMGNGWAGTNDPGERVFDVSVEDELFLDDLDLSKTLGHLVGGMFEWQGSVSDGTIDIDFTHVVQNPLINGVEIIRLGSSTNSAPVISTPGTLSVPENQTAAVTVVATDADGDPLTYSITGDADAAKFAINAQTGALSFLAAPDFEAPSDADRNGVYQVEVAASDGKASGTKALAITVTDVVEVADRFVFRLVNAESDTILDADLSDGVSGLAKADLAAPLAVAAYAAVPGSITGSVALKLSGPSGTFTTTESVEPYAIFGDVSGDFAGKLLLPGEYTFSATNAGVTDSIIFMLEAGLNDLF